MNDHLPQVQRRSFQYWFIDGIFEIALGILFLALSGYFYLQFSLPEESLARTLLDSGFILIFLALWYGTGWIVRLAKQRITYPRTGYLAYHKKPPSRRWVALLLGMLISGSFTVLLLMAPPTISWMPILTCLIFSALSFVFGWRAGLARFYVLACLALVTGVLLSLANLGDLLSMSLLFLLWALYLILAGGFTLVRYLRQHPPASEISNAG